MTHTYVEMEVSVRTHAEIKDKLLAAGYDQAVSNDGELDMHGIALVANNSTDVMTPEHTALVEDLKKDITPRSARCLAAIRALSGEVERQKNIVVDMRKLNSSVITERDALRAEVAALRKEAELFRKAANLAAAALDNAFNESNATYNATIDAALPITEEPGA